MRSSRLTRSTQSEDEPLASLVGKRRIKGVLLFIRTCVYKEFDLLEGLFNVFVAQVKVRGH